MPGLVSLLGASGGEVIGVTYYDSGRYPYRAADIATALSEQTGYSGEVGITAETGLASAQGTIVPLPAGVATGVAAVAQIFR